MSIDLFEGLIQIPFDESYFSQRKYIEPIPPAEQNMAVMSTSPILNDCDTVCLIMLGTAVTT